MAVVVTSKAPRSPAQSHAQPEPNTPIAASATAFFIPSTEPNLALIAARRAGEMEDSLVGSVPAGARVLK